MWDVVISLVCFGNATCEDWVLLAIRAGCCLVTVLRLSCRRESQAQALAVQLQGNDMVHKVPVCTAPQQPDLDAESQVETEKMEERITEYKQKLQEIQVVLDQARTEHTKQNAEHKAKLDQMESEAAAERKQHAAVVDDIRAAMVKAHEEHMKQMDVVAQEVKRRDQEHAVECEDFEKQKQELLEQVSCSCCSSYSRCCA